MPGEFLLKKILPGVPQFFNTRESYKTIVYNDTIINKTNKTNTMCVPCASMRRKLMTMFLRNDSAVIFTDNTEGLNGIGGEVLIFRSQATFAALDKLGLPVDQFCTPEEMEQKRRGIKFFEAIEGLSPNMKKTITQYIGYIASQAAQMAGEDMKFNVKKMHQGLIDENVEMLDVIKDLKSQIKVQDNTVKSLEEAQTAHRSASKQIEELKSKLADMEKEKTKIQNQLAKTTIANEKLQDKLNHKGKK